MGKEQRSVEKYDEDRMQEFLLDAISGDSNSDKIEDQKIIYVDDEPLIL